MPIPTNGVKDAWAWGINVIIPAIYRLIAICMVRYFVFNEDTVYVFSETNRYFTVWVLTDLQNTRNKKLLFACEGDLNWSVKRTRSDWFRKTMWTKIIWYKWYFYIRVDFIVVGLLLPRLNLNKVTSICMVFLNADKQLAVRQRW